MGVAATEDDIIRDEQERSNLLSAIADVETAIAVSTPGTRRVLENTLENAKKRIATLDKRIDEAKFERQAEQQAQMAAVAKLAAKETALSAQEREEYSGFLKEEFFTKKDFGKLEHFYAHAYDRLSEGGKDEMSKRIDAGIKRGEFKFSDLSETVQAKETQHRAAKTVKNASEQVEVGERNEAAHPSVPIETSAMKGHDFTSIDLSGMQISDVTSAPSVTAIPDASRSKPAQRSV